MDNWGTQNRKQNWELNNAVVSKHLKTSLCCLKVMLPSIRFRPPTSERMQINALITKKSAVLLLPSYYEKVQQFPIFRTVQNVITLCSIVPE